jgi:predicted transcriptional regulator
MATTIKLSPKLKARISRVVKGTDKSAHAFMLEAIEHETERAELRKRFVAAVDKAEKELEHTGLAYDADEVHTYVKALARGRKARPPKAKPWRD